MIDNRACAGTDNDISGSEEGASIDSTRFPLASYLKNRKLAAERGRKKKEVTANDCTIVAEEGNLARFSRGADSHGWFPHEPPWLQIRRTYRDRRKSLARGGSVEATSHDSPRPTPPHGSPPRVPYGAHDEFAL
ncbi:hypothetical protein KM043_006943 [Ampulex compressa]|nr:hypothetical protein KM043_006943 [Ampulex compressa]